MSNLNAEKYALETAFVAFGPVGHSPGPGPRTGESKGRRPVS